MKFQWILGMLESVDAKTSHRYANARYELPKATAAPPRNVEDSQ